MGQRVAIYCRVSTADQSCERQKRDLLAFAERGGMEVVGIWKEVASGAMILLGPIVGCWPLNNADVNRLSGSSLP